MILGGGVYQTPLIRKAKSMGLETIVVTPRGKYPGINIADSWLDVDTTDVTRLVAAAKELDIDGIVTAGTDVCMPAMGAVVDSLGLRGASADAALKSMNKAIMKQTLAEYDVATAKFETCSNASEGLRFARKIGFPVMVKAVDSSGSRGISRATSRDEFAAAWSRALSVSRSGHVIVEKFLEGTEFGAQAFVTGDRLVSVFPHNDTVTAPPCFTPIGHSMPTSLTEAQISETAELIERAVAALGIEDCVSNVDLMLVDGEPHIIEIGARIGATCLPENISIYAGQDVYEYLIQLALGTSPTFDTVDRQANASRLLTSDKAGRVVQLPDPTGFKDYGHVDDFQWDVDMGDHVERFRVGPDRIGHIIVKSGSAEESETLVNGLASMLTPIVD